MYGLALPQMVGMLGSSEKKPLQILVCRAMPM
jgi:hypothetical protein